MRTVAERQLAAWQAIAADWPAPVDDEGVGRCERCGKGILLWTDPQARPFRWSREEVLALTVLHLRNHHTDLDPGT